MDIIPTKPLHRGKFIFKDIQEGEGEDIHRISFNPPLTIEYSIWEKYDSETQEENFPDDYNLLGYVEYDFGLDCSTNLDEGKNALIGRYEGLTADSEPQDVLLKTVMYDLFHSFFIHPENEAYTHYHWALSGNLRSRVTLSV